MKHLSSLFAATLLTLGTSCLSALDDTYSGLHIDIPEEFEEDFGWREVDMWGSEYMFTTENGRMITLDVETYDPEEEGVFPPMELDIHMQVRSQPVQKGDLQGNLVELIANDRTIMCLYQLHDANFSYSFNFTSFPFDEENALNFFLETDGDVDFKNEVKKMMDSVRFD